MYVQSPEPSMIQVDDRSTRARIRDAAIATVADHGIAETTVRKVAERAGVSPGLVIHHFDSMDGLRSVCDEYVTSVIRRTKRRAMQTGPGFDLLAALEDDEIGPVGGYLARVIGEDSGAVADLVDDLVADAEGYLSEGVASGMVRSSDDPRGRAAVVVVWGLGALVLHRHLRRILGVDLLAPGTFSDPSIAAYLGPAYEILGGGILTPEMADRLRSAIDAVASGTPAPETTSPEGL